MVHHTMNSSSASAAKASSTINSIRCLQALAILGVLAGCASRLPPIEAPAPLPAVSKPAETTGRQLLRDNARWIEADWRELPGWGEDRAAELWPVLLRSCARPAQGWSRLCAQAALQAPADDTEALLWLMQRLRPYRVESLNGEAAGLATGYFEPQLEGRRQAQGAFQTPVLQPPPDLATRRPYLTRQQIAEQASRFKVIAYVSDPIELLVMQIQGSGRLRVTEADGRTRAVRLAFGGHNDQPYQSVGKLLLERGEVRDGSWSAIREWARQNPARLNELLAANPRYVFFREEPLTDPDLGPRGAQGAPLTPGRSVAVDKTAVPYGTPMWIASSWPRSDTPLRRLVMAQDTGSAITGAVRLDYFWGWGPEAEEQAGKMKQPLQAWVLWPADLTR
ncbi:MAG: MltA domain-containing protein [Paucibacter sp.]|nr:MltA domain-containing protein [Roseateles sp.]